MTWIPFTFKDAPKYGKLVKFSVYHESNFQLATELPIIVAYSIYFSLY